jgi:hypothetical protein
MITTLRPCISRTNGTSSLASSPIHSMPASTTSALYFASDPLLPGLDQPTGLIPTACSIALSVSITSLSSRSGVASSPRLSFDQPWPTISWPRRYTSFKVKGQRSAASPEVWKDALMASSSSSLSTRHTPVFGPYSAYESDD